MRIVITGGSGFIGHHLTDYLQRSGHDVLIIDKKHPHKSLETFHWQTLDISSKFVDKVIKDFEPDLLYHLSYEEQCLYDIESSSRIVDTCTFRNIPLVFSSTTNIIHLSDLHDKEDVSHYVNRYSITKATCEQYIRYMSKSGLRYTTLRFPNIYGLQWKPHGVVASFIVAGLQGKKAAVYGCGRQSRDFLHVSDAVKALILAGETAEQCGNITLSIGTGQPVAIRDLFKEVKKHINTLEAEQSDNFPGASTCNLNLMHAEVEIGFRAKVFINEGIERTVKEFKSNWPEILKINERKL